MRTAVCQRINATSPSDEHDGYPLEYRPVAVPTLSGPLQAARSRNRPSPHAGRGRRRSACGYTRCPPRYAAPSATVNPRPPIVRPGVRTPRRRSASETAQSPVAERFSSPWSRPTRRSSAAVCCQSVMPVTAAPTAPASPTPIAASAARSWCLLAPHRSRTVANVQAPSGTSVRTGWRGCPRQVPWRRSRIRRPVAPPAWYAATTAR